eukprot:CAMPEP_0119552610 /NCGR_PEP_ID=MMETSP1352-20130426/5545_1 /TAXON_ID=265584 /ORGANISM="Stauroneis constricta, Strain CCMP1120" /LENGTH=63 /DNA_ID=CAMNT_0007598863 /DNA_START=92 /DNA_END=281 /DNA_ORIENTATION=-
MSSFTSSDDDVVVDPSSRSEADPMSEEPLELAPIVSSREAGMGSTSKPSSARAVLDDSSCWGL